MRSRQGGASRARTSRSLEGRSMEVEHGGRGRQPGLRSPAKKLAGGRWILIAALTVSLEPLLSSPTPGGMERFPVETTQVGEGCLANECVPMLRSISPVRSGPWFLRPGISRDPRNRTRPRCEPSSSLSRWLLVMLILQYFIDDQMMGVGLVMSGLALSRLFKGSSSQNWLKQ